MGITFLEICYFLTVMVDCKGTACRFTMMLLCILIVGTFIIGGKKGGRWNYVLHASNDQTKCIFGIHSCLSLRGRYSEEYWFYCDLRMVSIVDDL